MPIPAIHRAFLSASASLAVGMATPVANAEVPDRPATVLHRKPVQLPGPGHTTVRHRVRIEQVLSGEGLAPGDEITVVSKTYRVPPGAAGSRGMRGEFRGPREARDKPAEPARPLPPQRIAVTTLGHPGDFASPKVRLLSLRMIAWATGRELDEKATAAARAATFDPPPTR